MTEIKGKVVTKTEFERIKQLHNLGVQPKDIQEMTKRSRSTISKVCNSDNYLHFKSIRKGEPKKVEQVVAKKEDLVLVELKKQTKLMERAVEILESTPKRRFF